MKFLLVTTSAAIASSAALVALVVAAAAPVACARQLLSPLDGVRHALRRTAAADDDARRLMGPPKPLKVGSEHPMRILLNPSVHSEEGANNRPIKNDVDPVVTNDGKTYTYTITHPGATYISPHMDRMKLQEGCVMKISDGGNNTELGQAYEMTGTGKFNMERDIWCQHITGDTVVIVVECREVPHGFQFEVDRIAAGDVELPEQRTGGGGGGDERRRSLAICGADDKQNAACFQSSHPAEYDKARAVARLLIQGTSLCTGWLASASNHLVTNEHCISSSTAAQNTDYEFMAEASNCDDSNCQLCHTGSIFSGATWIQGNSALDYALVQITTGDPAATYGFLTIDNRAAVIGEQIYIPQHPGGRAKELGIESTHSSDGGGLCHVNTFEPGCSSGSYGDVGYMCDTEGGSSGSPVLARTSHKVIALHHCSNCENRGVPIALVCDEICSLLYCSVDADCDDGDPCTTDACSLDGVCTNNVAENCCGNDICETGEDCGSCPGDCPSISGASAVCGNGICEAGGGGESCASCPADCNGTQGGKPENRYCCGDGGGTNPVGCDDGRCTTGGVTCTTDQIPSSNACCGDLVCEGAEDTVNCPVDCSSSSGCSGDAECDDGFFCNGPETCSGGSCQAGPEPCSGPSQGCDETTDQCTAITCSSAGGPCDIDSDCCSNKCKGKTGSKTCN